MDQLELIHHCAAAHAVRTSQIQHRSPLRSGLRRVRVLALVRVGARRGRVPTRPHGRNPLHFTLVADLNAQDDDGLGWSVLADARDPSRVQPGAMLLAGNRPARAVVRVVAIDDDGPVHFVILPGSVTKNRHLVDRTPS